MKQELFIFQEQMMPKPHYLLFIDNEPLPANLKDYFAQFNIRLVQQDHLEPIRMDDNIPDAILINWSILKNEPEKIKFFYHHYQVPLLIINDIRDEDSCISMLESGADDFIIKPLYPRELHARITAISRRVARSRQKIENEREVYLFTNWRLYPASRQIFNENKQELFLSAGEYDLLLTFLQQPQQILDREYLLQITKNSDLNPFDRRVDVQISRLRQKIEPDAKRPSLIKTIRNGGYMFTTRVVTLKESNLSKPC